MSRVRYILDNLNLIPDFYTEREGGNWKTWPKSVERTAQILKNSLKLRDPIAIEVEGLSVHSLAFGNPAAGTGFYLRWDCVNGWNLTQMESI